MDNITIFFKHKGLRTFLWVWFGQFVSIIGSGMTRFALLIWAYQQTSSATTLALLGAANYVAYLAFSPLAGVIIDRRDRRSILLMADILGALVTGGLLVLYSTGGLQMGYLYAAEAVIGMLESFQIPAYYASVTTLVPRDQLNRTNGLRSLSQNASTIIAPLLAGVLLAAFGIQIVMAIDLGTFLFSIFALCLINIPLPAQSEEGRSHQGNLWKEMRTGFNFIFQRPGLRGLLLIMFGMNTLASLTYFSILPAMVLARSGNSQWTLGVVQSALGVGGVIGALLLSTWGGPRKRIHSVLAGGVISFLLGDLFFGLGQSVWVWALAAVFSTLTIPFISGGQQSIWQVKVAPDLQGRVFSVKDTLQQMVNPLGYAVGGLLADYVFEPAMQVGRPLTHTFSWLVGSGSGAGMGLMFIATWILGTLFCLSGYLSPAVRNVETDLPDAV
jgi:MFS transporter, DHA3 family, macrolide efflux protein